LAFRLRRRSADGVWLGGDLALPRGPDMRELRAEKHDEGRVIPPPEEYPQGACRAVGRAHACLAQVKTDGRLAHSKEDRHDAPTEPHVPTADLGIGPVD